MAIKKINELTELTSLKAANTLFVADDNRSGNYSTQSVKYSTLYNSIQAAMPAGISAVLEPLFQNMIFDAIYPLGSIYITTGSAPSRGTWSLVADGQCLWGCTSGANETITQGLPKPTISISDPGHTHSYTSCESTKYVYHQVTSGGRVAKISSTCASTGSKTTGITVSVSDTAPYSSSNTVVQPPAYKVYVYRRTAI